MAEAISRGEYRELPMLARMAEQMSQMAQKLPPTSHLSTTSRAVLEVSHRSKTKRTSMKARTRRTIAAKPTNAGGYPRFRREGNLLVKIGWSKSSKAEYLHRAPRTVVLALVNTIFTSGHQRLMFTMDSLLPLTDPSDSTTVPDYQVYIALAWLRQEGVIRQHGREGYTLLVADNIDDLLEKRWNALPSGQ